jgi:3-oxoacid CoA-transferase subunit B/3-oxoadipate CoA-transferase beta subunit
MDLVAGVRRVVVVMDHCEKTGAPKFLGRCVLPLTGAAVVDLLITDLAVFEIDRKAGSAVLVEVAPGVTLDEIKAKTEAAYSVAPALG